MTRQDKLISEGTFLNDLNIHIPAPLRSRNRFGRLFLVMAALTVVGGVLLALSHFQFWQL